MILKAHIDPQRNTRQLALLGVFGWYCTWVRGLSAGLLPPIPVATSYASLDPRASAQYAIKYLGALPASSNLTLGNCGAAAEAVVFPGSGYRLEFVLPGPAQPCLDFPLPKFVAYAEQEFGDLSAAGHQGVYSQWEDNHIGMIAQHMDPFVQRLEKGSQAFFMRGVAPSFFDLFVALPGTGHIFEHTALQFRSMGQYPDIDLADWDLCAYEPPLPQAPQHRSLLRGQGIGQQPVLWRKMTFASADPSAARDFTVKYLGAVPMAQPHEVGNGSCALIEWVTWPGRCNALVCYGWHFVRADRKGGGPMNITDWRDTVEARRDVKGGVFDGYMWYHVKLWVADLDPYVQAFQQDGVPFMVRGWQENGVWALIFDMPGNADIIMLISDHLTAYTGERKHFHVCE